MKGFLSYDIDKQGKVFGIRRTAENRREGEV
jgi:hypothetical protein